MRHSLLLLPLLACKATSLGIDLPEGGRDAISMEDLSRDTWQLTDAAMGPDRSPGGDGARQVAERLQRRLQQMHLLPAFGEAYVKDGLVCGLRDGRSDKARLFFARNSGRGVVGAVSVAALISLAKSSDGLAPPPDTLIFCALPEPGGLERLAVNPPWPLDRLRDATEIGALGGETLSQTDGEPLGASTIHLLSTGAQPWQGGEEDHLERYDLRIIANQVGKIYDLTKLAPSG